VLQRLVVFCGLLLWLVGCQSLGNQRDLSAVLEEVSSSVVSVQSRAGALGSGFLLGDGIVVTTAHQALGSEIFVLLPDNRRQPWQAVFIDEERDIAIGRVASGAEQGLDLHQGQLRLGETVYALGNPFGMGITVTRGIVSAKPRAINSEYLIQTDAAINPGNSGGPLIDENGRVVGVVSARAALGSGIGFAVPSKVIAQLLLGGGDTSR